jgi:hypothetical protein
MIIRMVASLLPLLILQSSSFDLYRPMKEDEVWKYHRIAKISYEGFKEEENATWEHKCTAVDDAGVQQIDVKCVSGTKKVNDDDPESLVDEIESTYRRNAYGMPFVIEELRTTFEEDPLYFVTEAMQSPIQRRTVRIGTTFTKRDGIVEAQVMIEGPKKKDGVACFVVVEEGKFIKYISGQYRSESWIRTRDSMTVLRNLKGTDLQKPGELSPMTYEATVKLVTEKVGQKPNVRRL